MPKIEAATAAALAAVRSLYSCLSLMLLLATCYEYCLWIAAPAMLFTPPLPPPPLLCSLLLLRPKVYCVCSPRSHALRVFCCSSVCRRLCRSFHFFSHAVPPHSAAHYGMKGLYVYKISFEDTSTQTQQNHSWE